MNKDEKVIIGEHSYNDISRFSPKNEALKKVLRKEAQIVIADKEDVYAALARSLGGKVITLSPNSNPSNAYINPFTDLLDNDNTRNNVQEQYFVTGPAREEFIKKMQNFTPKLISNIEKREDRILFATTSISCTSPAEINNIMSSYIDLLNSLSDSIQIKKIFKEGKTRLDKDILGIDREHKTLFSFNKPDTSREKYASDFKDDKEYKSISDIDETEQ